MYLVFLNQHGSQNNKTAEPVLYSCLIYFSRIFLRKLRQRCADFVKIAPGHE